jgi:hypothetical protein
MAFLVRSSIFSSQDGSRHEARLLKHKLARLGELSTWGSGNQAQKLVVRRQIPGFEDKWVVAIKLDFTDWG